MREVERSEVHLEWRVIISVGMCFNFLENYLLMESLGDV